MRLLLALLGVCAAGCGTTGGKLIEIGFRAGGVSRAAAGPLTFTTPQGWTVTLTNARIALGPFYFNVEQHSGSTFRGGLVIIEATEQVIVDPLDPALKDVTGGADGETGDSRVVEIDLFPPDAHALQADVQLIGSTNIAHVAGTATKGSVTVPFAGPIGINTNLVTPEKPLVALERVDGAFAPLSFTAQTQALDLRVDPRVWFESVDFSALLGGTAVAGVYSWDAGNCIPSGGDFDSARCTFQNQLVGGVQSTVGAYQFAVSP